MRFSWRSSSAAALCPLPFNVVINDLEVNIKSPRIKFAADTEIGGVEIMMRIEQSCTAIQIAW